MDIVKLIEEIKRNAYCLEMRVENTIVKRYFLTPGEHYNRIILLTIPELSFIAKNLDGSLALLDISNDLVIQISEKGFIKANYSDFVSPEDKIRIEELLGKRDSFIYA